jgi:hypothetical protein
MEPQARASAFRLLWRQTWPDEPDDFTARSGDGFCRMYRVWGGPQNGNWFWTASRTHQIGTGYGERAREAALAAEAAFHGSE